MPSADDTVLPRPHVLEIDFVTLRRIDMRIPSMAYWGRDPLRPHLRGGRTIATIDRERRYGF